jgi:drug/metabolite transporter (DMT)-like permease
MAATAHDRSHLTRGYAIALAAAAILSTTAIFIRYLTQTYNLPALVLAFWRDGFVCLTLVPVLALIRPRLLRVGRTHLPYLLGYGFLLATFNAVWTLSVALNGAAVATVLVYSSAGFTALLGRWILAEHLGWGKLLAVAVSLSGCVLVSGALDTSVWRGNVLGIATGVLSGLGYAIYSLMGRSASQRGLNPWTTVLYVRLHHGVPCPRQPPARRAAAQRGGAQPTSSGWATQWPGGASCSCWRPGPPSPVSGCTTSVSCTSRPASRTWSSPSNRSSLP